MPDIFHSLHPERTGSWDHGDQGITRTEETGLGGGGGGGQCDPGSHPDLEQGRPGGAVRRAENRGLGPGSRDHPLHLNPGDSGQPGPQGMRMWRPLPGTDRVCAAQALEGCSPVEAVPLGKDSGGGMDGVLPGCPAPSALLGLLPTGMNYLEIQFSLSKFVSSGAAGCTPLASLRL